MIAINYGTLPDYIIACTAIIALFISVKEYRAYKRKDKMDTFAKYCERYSSDENIKKATEYLIAFIENKEIQEIDLTIYNKEMFLRFYEELELQIERGNILKEDVGDFFIYYAIVASMCYSFIEDTELNKRIPKNDLWDKYRTLVAEYSYLESEINDDFKKHHINSSDIKILIGYKKQ